MKATGVPAVSYTQLSLRQNDFSFGGNGESVNISDKNLVEKGNVHFRRKLIFVEKKMYTYGGNACIGGKGTHFFFTSFGENGMCPLVYIVFSCLLFFTNAFISHTCQ